jgi:predicted DNA-binding protein with PD1-like motif
VSGAQQRAIPETPANSGTTVTTARTDTTARRHVAQPGPVSAQRIDSLGGHSQLVEFELEPGLNLRDAIAGPLAAAGLASASLTFHDLHLAPFHYVRPALSTTPAHAAYYSDTFELPEGARLQIGNATYGRRDGQPFMHCHAVWTDPDGKTRGGHVLPDRSIVAAPTRVRAWGLSSVAMQSDPDAETGFTLFRPVAIDSTNATDATSASNVPGVAGAAATTLPRAVFARIRPNEDLLESMEALCERHGFAGAVVRASLGSIIGAEFEDGHVVEPIATEILVLDGTVARDAAGRPRARVRIALIDTAGEIYTGWLVRGNNPVLICFELLLEEADSGIA